MEEKSSFAVANPQNPSYLIYLMRHIYHTMIHFQNFLFIYIVYNTNFICRLILLLVIFCGCSKNKMLKIGELQAFVEKRYSRELIIEYTSNYGINTACRK